MTRLPSTSVQMARHLGLRSRRRAVCIAEEFTSVNRAMRVAPAGHTGGHAPELMRDRTGHRASTIDEGANGCYPCSGTPGRITGSGLAGRQSVRDDSLTTYYLRDYRMSSAS